MKIILLAFDGMTMFHLSTPLLVFREASRQDSQGNWQVTVASLTGADIETEEGLTIQVGESFSEVGRADWVVIPAWPVELPEAEPTLVARLKELHRSGSKIIGLCLGAFPLCQAGLLDGRSATTHWRNTEELTHRYPAVQVAPAALYLDHGDVLTSAGTAAALDACLHLVRKERGADLAAKIAAQLVVAPHRDGNQTQHTSQELPPYETSQDIAHLLDYIEGNLGSDLTLDALAEAAHLSSRHLSRRFRQVTGTTPAQWIKQRRLNASRRLLEETGLSVAQIAQAVGFSSVVTFRQGFVAAFDTTPQSYRHRFSVREETS